jgi:hypothetical protein
MHGPPKCTYSQDQMGPSGAILAVLESCGKSGHPCNVLCDTDLRNQCTVGTGTVTFAPLKYISRCKEITYLQNRRRHSGRAVYSVQT